MTQAVGATLSPNETDVFTVLNYLSIIMKQCELNINI